MNIVLKNYHRKSVLEMCYYEQDVVSHVLRSVSLKGSAELKSIVTRVALFERTSTRSASLICFFCISQSTYGTESHRLRDTSRPRSKMENLCPFGPFQQVISVI